MIQFYQLCLCWRRVANNPEEILKESSRILKVKAVGSWLIQTCVSSSILNTEGYEQNTFIVVHSGSSTTCNWCHQQQHHTDTFRHVHLMKISTAVIIHITWTQEQITDNKETAIKSNCLSILDYPEVGGVPLSNFIWLWSLELLVIAFNRFGFWLAELKVVFADQFKS